MKEIKTTNGYIVLVDDDDFEWLNSFKWRKETRCVRREALKKRGETGSPILMHRFIMNPPRDKYIDHINHNILDNRKENLRIVTPNQNQYNSLVLKPKTSKYKGVYWHKGHQYWCVAIGFENKKRTISNFKYETEAAIAYNFWAKHLFGEYACLNEVYAR